MSTILLFKSQYRHRLLKKYYWWSTSLKPLNQVLNWTLGLKVTITTITKQCETQTVFDILCHYRNTFYFTKGKLEISLKMGICRADPEYNQLDLFEGRHVFRLFISRLISDLGPLTFSHKRTFLK